MRLGVITGSGSHALAGLEAPSVRSVRTRFGAVEVTDGTLAGLDAVHLLRHGPHHERLSSHLDHRAHIAAMLACEVDAVLAVTVCGALDASLKLGELIVFDDLHFPSNRLPDGTLCSLFDRAGEAGAGHWVFDRPFSEELRATLADGARATAAPLREEGCYGHVDGPRFNSRSEIRSLQALGVSAVSQTAGPETVLCGEAELPYALLGYVTDHANGVMPSPPPPEELLRHLSASSAALAGALHAAAQRLARTDVRPTAPGAVLRIGR